MKVDKEGRIHIEAEAGTESDRHFEDLYRGSATFREASRIQRFRGPVHDDPHVDSDPGQGRDVMPDDAARPSAFQAHILAAIGEATRVTPRFKRRGMGYAEIREAAEIPGRQGFSTTLHALVKAGELTTEAASWERRKWRLAR